MANDGSAPQCWIATVSSEVVVVLPWVPATATARRPTITEASAPARCTTASPRRRASTSSGLDSRIAVDTTTVSTSPTFSARCPRCTTAPSARSAARVTESLASLPLTGSPRASMIRAMPDIPAPPMPMKCTRPRSSAGTGRSVGATSTPLTIASLLAPCVRPRPPRATRSTSRSSASRPPAALGRGAPSSPTAPGRSSRGVSVAVHPGGGAAAASSTSSPPPASTTGRAFSRCSPLPIGSGT